MLAELPEHILAALVVLDIDDCTIRFHQGEAPVLDGSALPFLQGLLAAGVIGPDNRPPLRLEMSWRGVQLCWVGGAEVTRARTFLYVEQAKAIGGLDFFPGARPDCALVLDSRGGSRYGRRPRMANEPAWHKMVDLLGDLGAYRARGQLTGLLQAVDPGHKRNPHIIEAALRNGSLRWVQ
jgi:UDP-3-O-acyl-N-acetylglucosamine deacetylase